MHWDAMTDMIPQPVKKKQEEENWTKRSKNMLYRDRHCNVALNIILTLNFASYYPSLPHLFSFIPAMTRGEIMILKLNHFFEIV